MKKIPDTTDLWVPDAITDVEHHCRASDEEDDCEDTAIGERLERRAVHRSLRVYVTNAVWGCDDADPDDGEHPEEFDARVELPEDLSFHDPLEVDEYIHHFLIDKCDCCLIEGDFDWSPEVQRYK